MFSYELSFIRHDRYFFALFGHYLVWTIHVVLNGSLISQKSHHYVPALHKYVQTHPALALVCAHDTQVISLLHPSTLGI